MVFEKVDKHHYPGIFLLSAMSSGKCVLIWRFTNKEIVVEAVSGYGSDLIQSLFY
jgi:hypothetical protein